ncbi:MAG: response regulator [Oxalobacteraceae bacterium]|nr:MAG: response regulator [Oxalobacteraceae bacterium]
MSKCVMLIEDEPLHQKLYTIWLQWDGHIVHHVPDERLAYVQAAQVQPDVIIADIRLPHLDGREVIRTLKARAETKHIPVLAITVLDAVEDEDACYSAGADLFLNKRAGREVLLAAVRQA